MSARAQRESSYTLTLSHQERESLLGLLRRASSEAVAGSHHAHGPDLRGMIERLERLAPDPPARPPTTPVEGEEGAPVIDELYIDESGRFQMAAEDLESFISFLLDRGVVAGVEPDGFRSGGAAYGYGRLAHPYDIESVASSYRTWRIAHPCRAAAMA